MTLPAPSLSGKALGLSGCMENEIHEIERSLEAHFAKRRADREKHRKTRKTLLIMGMVYLVPVTLFLIYALISVDGSANTN